MLKAIRWFASNCPIFGLIVLLSACSGGSKSYVVGVSQCSEDSWREKMNLELRSAAYAKGNVRIRFATASDNSELQKHQIEEFVQEGVDLLIVAPNQANSISSALDEAYDKGVHVMLVDRQNNSQKFTAFVGADNREIGRAMGHHLAKLMQRHGTVLEMQGLEGSSPAELRHEGFCEAMASYPDIQVIDGGHTDWTSQQSLRVVRAFLQAHTKQTFDAVFGHNDRIALSCLTAFEEAGRAKPLCVGIDGLLTPDGGVSLVKDGRFNASYIYPTRGDVVMDLAMQVLQGDTIPRYTWLTSTMVTPENASLMYQQMDELRQMQLRMSELNGKIDFYLLMSNTQHTMLLLVLLVAVLVIVLIIFVFHTKLRKRQMAAQQERERLRFFTNVSHEFRTPLTLIADPLDRVARSGELSAENSRLLQLAKRQSDVMLNLVGQILDLRKIQNNKMRLQPQHADIAQLVSQWVEGFRPMAEAHEVAVSLLAPTQLNAVTDPDKLERITYNLISNAMKYAPRGSLVEITLSTAGDRFTLSVKDQGRGMTRQETAHVFERFYQSPSAASGTGIGLSLVKELVELMKGTISVESEPEKGTRFEVSLPVQTAVTALPQEERESIAPAASAASHAAVDAPQSDAPLVLVVDDNADVRAYLCSLLRQEAYRVAEAADGAEGLRLATDTVPDVVISDVMMPILDGHELCQRLKTQTATSHVPVIMLTAQAMDEQRASGYDWGADAYITKPFSSRVLLSRVQNLLKNRCLLKMAFSVTPVSTMETREAREATPQKAPRATQQEASQEVHEETREELFLAAFRKQVEAHLADSEFSVETLAQALNLSRVQMYRKVKALTGNTPVELIREARLQRADELLHLHRYTVSEVAYQVGFSSPSYFTKCYKEQFGHTPGEEK